MRRAFLSTGFWKRFLPVPNLILASFLLVLGGTLSPTGFHVLAQRLGADGRVEGMVLDQMNLPVAGARITLSQKPNGIRMSALSSSDKFVFESLTSGIYDLRVEAAGFAPQTLTVDLRSERSVSLEVRLVAARIDEEITVTATRIEQKLADVPASVNVIRREEIKQSPGLVADDVLRQVPTFSLFRRTSSLAAHPTAQGVSLRGIGPSGVSRTLVLLDSFPFNDPFGGWVYWTRVPLMSVDRVELVDGTSSNLYGNYAIGGVISIVTKNPERRTLVVKPQYGNRNTPKFDFFASDVWKNFGGAIEGSVFSTDGYRIVLPRESGLVDTRADVNYRNFNVKLQYNPSARWNVFLKGGYFGEDRNNGKILENNGTQWKFAGGGIRFRTPDESDWQVLFFAHFHSFRSTFLAVSNNRNTGRLTLTQQAPTDGFGGLAQWSKRVSRSQYVMAGADWRWIDGETDEGVLDTATGRSIVQFRFAGGTQKLVGGFFQDLITPLPRLQITLGARVDHWRNYKASERNIFLTTNRTTITSFKDKENTVGSPRIAMLYHFTDRLSAWGAVNWGFRAPTLNELYRQFRVGTVLTLANDQLGPERLLSGEGGVNFAPRRNLVWRATGFWNRFKDPVSNITRSIVGTQITRMRQNLGEARIWGIQSDLEYQVAPAWRFSVAYLYELARVESFPSDRTLIGNLLPQVPKHRASVQAAYTNPRYVNVAIQGQFVGAQFDDDLNRLRLASYFLTDLTAARPIGESFEIFLGVQNIFDRQYFVGTNPSTLGTPVLVHGGFRLRLTGHSK